MSEILWLVLTHISCYAASSPWKWFTGGHRHLWIYFISIISNRTGISIKDDRSILLEFKLKYCNRLIVSLVAFDLQQANLNWLNWKIWNKLCPFSVCVHASNENINSLIYRAFSFVVCQGLFGDSEKVKWRGTWVMKTVISRHIYHPEKMLVYLNLCNGCGTTKWSVLSIDMILFWNWCRVLTAKDNTLLRELRHPNILQFLGSIVQGEEMILITEYLPKVD